MAEFTITKHYGGKVEIKFYPNSHRYQLVGEKNYLISVTGATSMFDKSRPLLIWASRLTEAYLKEQLKNGINESVIGEAVNQHNVKRDEAATKGSLVHEWCEDYIKGRNPDVPEDEEVRNSVLAFLKWVREYEVRFLFSEKKIFSKKHKFVGTMDAGFTMGTEAHKIKHPGDLKSSSGHYIDQSWQLSAYQEAESEEFGTEWGDACIMRFDKKTGEFDLKWYRKEEHQDRFKGFLACLTLKQQDKQWSKDNPWKKK